MSFLWLNFGKYKSKVFGRSLVTVGYLDCSIDLYETDEFVSVGENLEI